MTASLRELVTETPEIVARLRSAVFHATANHPDPELTAENEIRHIMDRTSKPPFDVTFMDQADLEAATLIQWVEELTGDAVRGAVWRVDGFARGLLYDDMTPVLDARDTLLRLLEGGHFAAELGDVFRALSEVRDGTLRVADWLRDEDEVAVDPVVDDGQIGLVL